MTYSNWSPFTATSSTGWASCASSTTSNSTSSWGTYTLTDYQWGVIRSILLSDDDASRAKKVKKENVDVLL